MEYLTDDVTKGKMLLYKFSSRKLRKLSLKNAGKTCWHVVHRCSNIVTQKLLFMKQWVKSRNIEQNRNRNDSRRTWVLWMVTIFKGELRRAF